MSKTGLIVLLIQVSLFFQGCAPLEYLDGSSKNEIDTFKSSKSEMRSEVEKLRSENKTLQRQIDVLAVLEKEHRKLSDENEHKIAEIRDQNKLLQEKLRRREAENQQLRDEVELVKLRGKNELATMKEEIQLLGDKLGKQEAENQRLRDEVELAKAQLKNKTELVRVRIGEQNELARMRDENELLKKQVKNITSENQRIRYENMALVKMLTRREAEEKAAAAKSEMMRRDLQKLKIKVLSRDSRDFAERIAAKLRKMGYSINSVGYAPRSQFLPNTVYFALEFKEEAEHLVASLGGGARFEALHLPSVFDLIIVTGKEQ